MAPYQGQQEICMEAMTTLMALSVLLHKVIVTIKRSKVEVICVESLEGVAAASAPLPSGRYELASSRSPVPGSHGLLRTWHVSHLLMAVLEKVTF